MHGMSPTASTSNPSPSSDPDSDHGIEEHDSLLDPFELESDEDESSNDENLLQNTQGNTGPDRSKALLNAKIPLNPFPSILASDRRGTNVRSEIRTVESHKRPGRQYDVDSFTRLLLTGEAGSRELSSTGETHNTNSTNAISSASLPTVPGPRLNNRQNISQGSQGSALNDKRQGMVSKSDGRRERMQLAASQHHPEKSAEGASQEIIFSQDLPSSPLSSATSPVQTTSSSTPSSPINLNKPLPPPPAASKSQMLPSVYNGVSVGVNVRENTFSNQASPSDSNPPLPLVSRYSSLTRLNSLVVTPEQPILGSANRLEELQASPISPPPPGSKQPPPPPPPPRRQGRARGISASSTSSAISGASASLIPSSNDESSSRPFKQQPALPPARTPSNSSMTRPTRRSTHPDSPSIVPPPVPPPRRNSSRSSYNRAGQAAEYSPNRQHSDLWALWASPSARGQELPETDVLAGLSELQREVDELRGRIHG